MGPFNLGLSALLKPVNEVSALFFDQKNKFDWHPGLLLDTATLQVPFMADLVTMADPQSRFSFLNFLKETNRLYKFYIRENFFVLRKEYNLYCQWVADQLESCRFGKRVANVYYDDDGRYRIIVKDTKTNEEEVYFSYKIVLGTGTQPNFPDFMDGKNFSQVVHTSQYLWHKESILKGNSVSVIGSGQSAAEVFQDLLPYSREGFSVNWFTRPDRFFPMEYSKLTLELTSPEYVDHFYDLTATQRKNHLKKQAPLYKGISYDLINEIYDSLYEMSVGDVPLNISLQPSSQLNDISKNNGVYDLKFTHVQENRPFVHQTDYVILATGYTYKTPEFLKGINDCINYQKQGLFDVARNYTVDAEQNIFVQNAELHTHGFVAPDLGMGAYRNSCIINEITKKETYKVEKRIAFQEFGTASEKEIAPIEI